MAYETAQEERERQDREKAEDIQRRQVRLGHIPAPEEKPKSRRRSTKKAEEVEEEAG